MDPDFVDELILREQAQADHELLSIKTDDKEIKKQQGDRRAQLARWRREVGG